MNSTLPLCEEFFEKITARLDHHDFRLTITANQPSITVPYYVDEKTHSIELIIFKTTFLSLFQEAHTYFNRTFSDQSMFQQYNFRNAKNYCHFTIHILYSLFAATNNLTY